jgi:hypothetical protein
MTNWLGKMWGLRLFLWLLAIGVSFGVWQWAAVEFRHLHLFGRTQRNVDQLMGMGVCPALLRDNNGSLHAWDWRNGKRWRIPSVPNRRVLPITRDGVTERILFLYSGDRIVSLNVQDPRKFERCFLPDDAMNSMPITCSRDGKFVVVIAQDDDEFRVRVIEFATGKTTGSMDIAEKVIHTTKGDEFELYNTGVLKNDADTPIKDDNVTGTRWRITDDGALAQSDVPAASITPEIRASGGLRITSMDGRYTAEISGDDDFVTISAGGATTGTVAESLTGGKSFNAISFSNDGDYLFAEDYEGNFQVFDTKQNSLVADNHIVERRTRFARVLMGIEATLAAICLVLALRSSVFEYAALYYVLATTFADGAILAAQLGGEFMPFFFNYVTFIAVGLFWAWNDQPLLRRLAWGAFALVALFGGQFMERMSLSMIEGVSIRSSPLHETYRVAIQGTAIAALSALPGWLIYLVFGWYVAREDGAQSGRRFQFGLGSMFLATLVAAISFAQWRELSQELSSEELPMPSLAPAAALTALMFVMNGLVAWLVAGVSFRKWTRRSVIVFTILFVILLVPMPVAAFTIPRMDGRSLSWKETLVVSGLLPFHIAALIFPLWLARRHGYRWVRANSKPATIEPAPAAAG